MVPWVNKSKTLWIKNAKFQGILFIWVQTYRGNFQICVSVTLMVKNVWCKTNIWTWFSYIFPGYNYRERFNFFRKYDVTPRRKMKDGISLTKYTEIWYLLQIFWKYGLFKKDCAGTWFFLYHLERRYFFPENMVFFPWKE